MFTKKERPEEITAEVILTPKKQTESTLISLPRAEYEQLLQKSAKLDLIVSVLTNADLSSYVLSELIAAMFPKPELSYVISPEENTAVEKPTDDPAEVTPDA